MTSTTLSLWHQAIQGQPVKRIPLWMMRQAGRYLPEYQKLRRQVPDFMTFCQQVDLVTEAALQPLRRFSLDAAIVFSDILTLLPAMGVDLVFVEQQGPLVATPIRTREQVISLNSTCLDSLRYVFDAVSSLKRALRADLPLIGFAGSPWTLACYMVEGGSSRLHLAIKHLLYTQPALLHSVLNKITQLTIGYLSEQIRSGADAIQLFDTWGGILSEQAYQAFSLAYLKRIIAALKKDYSHIPIVLFTRGGGLWLDSMASTGCDALSLDWTVSLAYAQSRLSHLVALQGNLDPAVLLSTPEVVIQETKRLLESLPSHQGYIFNLGHGIHPKTPIASIEAMIDTVQSFRISHPKNCHE